MFLAKKQFGLTYDLREAMAAYCPACKKSSHRGSDHAPGSRLGGGTQEVTSLPSFLASLFTDILSVLPCSADNVHNLE